MGTFIVLRWPLSLPLIRNRKVLLISVLPRLLQTRHSFVRPRPHPRPLLSPSHPHPPTHFSHRTLYLGPFGERLLLSEDELHTPFPSFPYLEQTTICCRIRPKNFPQRSRRPTLFGSGRVCDGGREPRYT